MPKFFSKDSEVQPSQHQPQIRVAKSAYRKLLFRRIFAILGYSFLGIFVIYLCFASTIMRVVPTTSGAGFVPVKENTHPGGILPSGETVLVDTESEKGREFLDRLTQSFVPSKTAAVVKIVSGPYGEFEWLESGIITVNGELTEAYLPERPILEDGKPKNRLLGEYLSVCISGDCTPGEAIFVSEKKLFGLTLGSHTLTESSTVDN